MLNCAQDAAQTEEVTWQDMWRHLTGDCEAALVLRLALDDANSGVIAAAAAGLHALLDSRGGASQDDFPDLGEWLFSCFTGYCQNLKTLALQTVFMKHRLEPYMQGLMHSQHRYVQEGLRSTWQNCLDGRRNPCVLMMLRPSGRNVMQTTTDLYEPMQSCQQCPQGAWRGRTHLLPGCLCILPRRVRIPASHRMQQRLLWGGMMLQTPASWQSMTHWLPSYTCRWVS